MITDQVRMYLHDAHALDIVNAYLAAVEAQDLTALGRMMAPDVELVHANHPPIYGRDGALELIGGYLRIVDWVEFEVRTILSAEGCVVVEKVNVAAAPSGSQARIRTVTILEAGEDDLLTSIRIYSDTGDLFRKLHADRAERAGTSGAQT